MLIVYDSLTGNVERFVKSLPYESVKIEDGLEITRPYVLVTYTTGFGEIPNNVRNFLDRNPIMPLGVSASGNRNWGDNFGKSAKLISKLYNVPFISSFELFGTAKDKQYFMERVDLLEQTCGTEQHDYESKSGYRFL